MEDGPSLQIPTTTTLEEQSIPNTRVSHRTDVFERTIEEPIQFEPKFDEYLNFKHPLLEFDTRVRQVVQETPKDFGVKIDSKLEPYAQDFLHFFERSWK